MDEIKESVAATIEKYHQDHFYAIYPAGKVQDWVLRAVAERIVKPMQDEIEALKNK